MRAPNRSVPFQWLRTGALAVTVMTLAAGAHLFGGGILPPPFIVMALTAMTGLAATLATRLKLEFPALVALLGAGQLLLHEALTAFGPTIAVDREAAGHHSVSPALSLAADTAASHGHTAHTPAGALMLAAHVAATLAAAALLAKGEQALWQLAAWLQPLVRLPRHFVLRPDGGPLLRSFGQPPVFIPRPWRNLRQDSRRGPPAVVVLH